MTPSTTVFDDAASDFSDVDGRLEPAVGPDRSDDFVAEEVFFEEEDEEEEEVEVTASFFLLLLLHLSCSGR